MSKKNKKTEIDNDIINFYEKPEMKDFLIDYPNPNFSQNQMKTPFMSVICSATGGGKTNLLMNMLKRFDNTFKHIYIVNQESEPLYDFLQKTIPKGLTITHKLSDLPDFKKLGENKKDQTLFVFDDLVKTKDQSYIETLYKRGRKCGCSCIYITQSFFDTPIFLRKQLHYLLLLSISGKKDLQMILKNYTLGIDDEQLLEIFRDATQQRMNFLKIDVRNPYINKKFSKNFTEFYEIE